MTRQSVIALWSYDTEMAVGRGMPEHIVSSEGFAKLSLDEKKALWADYLRVGIWENDPDHGKRAVQQLEMIGRLGELFELHDGVMTSFILGQALDFWVAGMGQERVRAFYANRKGIDVQSHSYNHLTYGGPQDPTRIRTSPNLPLDEVSSQLKRANDAIEKHLGVRPWGLRTPMGNTSPFDERRILEALRENGMRFVSSWLKKAVAEPNSPSEAQPFTYASLGFEDIWEIPGVGKYDVHFIPPSRLTVFGEEGWATLETMTSHYLGVLEEALKVAETATKPVYVPFVYHPWATALYDPELKMHEELLAFCDANAILIRSYAQAHEMLST